MDAETAKQKLLMTLNAPQRQIVDAFNGTQASRAEIAERSGYSAASSGYRDLISSLSSIGVVVYPSTGMVDLADWVREILMTIPRTYKLSKPALKKLKDIKKETGLGLP